MTMTTSRPHLGLISAMHQEQAGLAALLQSPRSETRGMRDYVSGTLHGMPCTCVLSRWGKTAAAATAAMLIERFGVTHLLFTGVAGAASREVAVGDIVIADSLVQHDMDASPLFPRFEIPLLGVSRFGADAEVRERLDAAARGFIEQDAPAMLDAADRADFGIRSPRIHRGLIASGDQFIGSQATLDALGAALPGLLAVEMEGAAVAQVCHEFGLPFGVVRTISDDANEHAPIDFMRFVERIAARYTLGIVARYCRQGGQ
jgi:adenosylhomocysteine nucleosidase